MSARLYLAFLLMIYSLAQGSTAVSMATGGGNSHGVYSYYANYLASDPIDIWRNVQLFPRDGYLTTDGMAFGVGSYTEHSSLSASGGFSETDDRRIGFGQVSVYSQGTAQGDTVFNNQAVSMDGTNILNEVKVQSPGDVKITITKSDSGSMSTGGSFYAGSTGSAIFNTIESPLTIGPNGDGERYAYNGYGYADIKVHIDNGSMTLEPLPLVGDELMNWHLFGSGSLAEMFIQAVNSAGPYASIHAASPGFLEAYPSASVTYNEADVKA